MNSEIYFMKQSIKQLNDTNPFKETIHMGIDQIMRFEEEKVNWHEQELSHNFSFRLISEKYPSGSIDVPSFLKIVGLIQESVINAAGTIKGVIGSRGPIPKWVIEKNKFVITSTAPGSFVVNLRPNPQDSLDLFEDDDFSIEILEDLLNKIKNTEDIIDIAEIYGLRTWNTLKRWAKSLEQSEIEFEFNDNKNNQQIFLNKEKIKSLNIAFNENKIEESIEIKSISGELIKIDINSKEVTLSDELTEENKVIHIKDNSLKNIPLATNTIYKVKVEAQKLLYNNTKEVNKFFASSANDFISHE